ncbi:MAG: histidinol-phosphate transaminase [Thermodesulfovibrionia bacterium]|nr:histidinol-phosphate transaminase [Thermodesulfovibrionia bacterium]
MNIKKLVKPNVRSLRAYQAAETPCRVKLDANESPYGYKALSSVQTNRYPDPEAKALRKLMAKEFKVKPENILHGNGSDELIYYLITTFGGPVLYPVPTFSMYGIIAQALGEKKVEAPLDEKFDLDEDKMLGMMEKIKPRLIFLSSPNNPTGNCFSSNKITRIIKQSKGVVVVDEAYQPFSDKKSFLPLLKKYNNLVILKTLSKIGFAAIRVGFMVAGAEIINETDKVRLPFNLNSLSQNMAIKALKNKKQMLSSISSIVTERKRLFNEIDKIDSAEPYQSDANFILFKVENSESVFKGLLEKGVLVRNMKGLINGCLRVTVGTPKENTAFLKALKRLL